MILLFVVYKITVHAILTVYFQRNNMVNDTIRVRFAPAPTGMMHLGNIRTALMNYLFAKQKGGIFVLRIEDTDPQRNYDPQAIHIREDLEWLNIIWDEGVGKGGKYGPYFQSERSHIYQEKLDYIASLKIAYRCFCTEEELNKKRERQQLLKMPPRYDRTCLHRTPENIEELLTQSTPFIWRLKLDHSRTVVIQDLARGAVKFELQHFSDLSLTRQDGSFTFVFANFVDDMTMHISHIFRGEEHFSNTAGQAALYEAFKAPMPVFFHMPLICNLNGQKLSKRDFGFSLRDLRAAGYTPEAIVNYLGIIGTSFEQEVMPLTTLAQALNFDSIHTTGHIKYDAEKLAWMNHKWIARYSTQELVDLCKPFLCTAYPQINDLDQGTLALLIEGIKTDLTTLRDCVQALKFYFEKPMLSSGSFEAIIDPALLPVIKKQLASQLALVENTDTFISAIKKSAKDEQTPLKSLFWFIRVALTGHCEGPAIHDLMNMLGAQESLARLQTALDLI
jgi:nondiscriminating glutamyl-tRNA synthetase